MRKSIASAAPLVLALMAPLQAQHTEIEYEGVPAIRIANDRIEAVVLKTGGSLASLVFRDAQGALNPLWNPARMEREEGKQPRRSGGMGHFVCVDGFGPTSAEEQKAGLSSHGEASKLPVEKLSARKEDGVLRLSFEMALPLVHEVFRRTFEMPDGENIVYVDSQLESQLAFDRPVVWAEHATIGSPFLAPRSTVVHASVGPCRTRPYDARRQAVRTLASGKDFRYPVAPLAAGGERDLTTVPDNASSVDHVGCAMDPSKRLAWVTALRADLGLLLGYVWRREEYPWIQEWMNYPASGKLARGLEFSTQPYDVPRREAITLGSMFGVPTYRWLPAKSKIGSRFLVFWTSVPKGFSRVDDVTIEGGKLRAVDRKSGRGVELPARLPL